MAIRDELLKELLAEYKKPEDLLGPNGLLKQLTGALVEKALQAEMTEHLGYEKHASAGRGSGNSRNGASEKTLKTEAGEVAIEVPRDRNATFEPKLVKKHQTHFDGFDDKIISMYARGMTVPPGVEVIVGDSTDPDSLTPALAGVEAVFLVWAAGPATVSAAVARLARSVQRVVFLSSPHQTPHPFFRQSNPMAALHANVERELATSGLPSVILRPGGRASRVRDHGGGRPHRRARPLLPRLGRRARR